MGTKQLLLDAAERLFAEKGFAATSLRTITAEAGVNLAAVNYHFRSKEALLQAVLARRLAPVNQKRLEMLSACEAGAGGGPLPLDGVVEAFLAPPLRLFREAGQDRMALQRLLGRIYLEPGARTRQIFAEQFGEVARRFTVALKRALPGLPAEELFWRIHFTIGVMAHTLAGRHLLEAVSGGLCDPNDPEGALARMVAFVVAGLRAPLARRRNQRKAAQGEGA